MNAAPAHDHADFLALRNGEDAALARLMGRWERPLFSFAWRYLGSAADARDVTVEAFVRLYQNRARMTADSNLSAWLFTTLTRLCHNHDRWRKRHPSADLDAGERLQDRGRTPEQAAEFDEVMAALAVAVERLPHDLRSTLLLHHYERLSYREIAAITGCSERGVETRLYRARDYLRGELAAFMSESDL